MFGQFPRDGVPALCSILLPALAELSAGAFSLPGCCNYLYRMKALDAIRASGKGAAGGGGRGGLAVGKRGAVLARGRVTVLAREERPLLPGAGS